MKSINLLILLLGALFVYCHAVFIQFQKDALEADHVVDLHRVLEVRAATDPPVSQDIVDVVAADRDLVLVRILMLLLKPYSCSINTQQLDLD